MASTTALAPRTRVVPSALAQQGRSQVPWILLCALVAALVLAPMVPLQWRAFQNDAEGLRALVNDPTTPDIFITTLQLGIGAAAVAVVLGTTLALAVDSMSPRMRKWFGFIPVLPMVIPSVAHVVGFVFLFSPENGYVNAFLRATPLWSGNSGPVNVYTPFWIIVYTGVHLAAFVYLFVYTGLQNLGADYDLAARVNGASAGRVLTTITLPMLRPSLIYSSVVVFMLSLGQFTGPLMLGRREGLDVITTRMFHVTAEYPVNYALASALGTPLLVMALLLVVFQRRVMGNQARFVGRGDMSSQEKPPASRLAKWIAGGFVVVFILLSAVLPLLALAFVALSPFWTSRIDFSTLTLDHVQLMLADPRLSEAVSTTLTVSAIAIVLTIPLGTLVAMGLHNRARLWKPLASALDVLSNLPLSMPAALIGFGFLFAFSLPWVGLSNSRTGLVIAYVTIMLPYAVRYQMAAFVSLGGTTLEASRVAGASALRTLAQIVFPLTKRNIAASAAIMFVLLTHEFGVSVLLRGPDSTVMSVMLFERFTSGLYPQVAVAALIMTAITGLGVAVALAVGGRKAMEGM